MPEPKDGSTTGASPVPPRGGDKVLAESVGELSKGAQNALLALLLASSYCLLTLSTTSDSSLVANSGVSTLPVVNVAVPIRSFYVFAPCLLLGLYLYFHSLLMTLARQIDRWARGARDGDLEDHLSSSMITLHLWRLRAQRPGERATGRLADGIGFLVGWWLVPGILFLFWARYLARHDWWVSILHACLLAAAFLTAAGSRQWLRRTLRHEPTPPALRNRAFATQAAAVGLVITALFWTAWSSIARQRDPLSQVDFNDPAASFHPNAAFLSLLQPYAELEERDVSSRIGPWTGQPEKAQEEQWSVQGAILRGADLRHARATKAFLVKADLRNADLRWAHLAQAAIHFANLQGARLAGADLEHASLRGADLTGADLKGADLHEADLTGARLVGATFDASSELTAAVMPGIVANTIHLNGADLRFAILTNANFTGGELHDTRLQDADLTDAILEGAELTGAQLQLAKMHKALLARSNLDRVALDRADLTGADLHEASVVAASLRGTILVGIEATAARFDGSDLAGAELTRADLRNAFLVGATLHGAHLEDAKLARADLTRAEFTDAILVRSGLQGATCTGARFTGAVLCGADFTGAAGLTQAQLAGACGDGETRLPPGLEVEECARCDARGDTAGSS